MFRLLRLTLDLLVLFIALVSAARLSGDTQPSLLTVLSTNHDGTPCERPCLFGIRPGKVSIDEAIAIVRTHWFLSNVRMLKSTSYSFPLAGDGKGLFAGKQVIISLVPGPGDQNPIMVVGVGFVLAGPGQDITPYGYSPLPIVSLGTFIALFGDPETFYKTSYDNSQYFDFAGQGIAAHVESASGRGPLLQRETYEPRLGDPVMYLEINEPFPRGPLRMEENLWCGFTARECRRTE